MTISFPALPATGQTHGAAGVVWRWDAEKWLAATVAEAAALPGATLVTTSTTLPLGFAGTVLVNQTGPVTITLPASPTTGQHVTVKDANGQAGTHAITIAGTIEGVSGMTIGFAYGWVSLTYSGTQWVQI